jgi:hypothetical protein
MRARRVGLPSPELPSPLPRRLHPHLVAWARHLAHRLLYPVGSMSLTPAADGLWTLTLDGEAVAAVGPASGAEGWASVEPRMGSGSVSADGASLAFLFRRDGYLVPDAYGVEVRVETALDLAPGFTAQNRDASAWIDALNAVCNGLVPHDFLGALQARFPAT